MDVSFRSRSLVLLALAFVSLLSHGHAALAWEATALEIVGDPDDTAVGASFRFKNDSKTPVTVSAVNPSCSCMTAEGAKKTYGPGESGEIPAKFHYVGAVKRQTKQIVVTTDDGAPPIRLDLTVEVPPPTVELQPQVLIWAAGATPETKTIRVNLRPDRGFRLVGAKVKRAAGMPIEDGGFVADFTTKSDAEAEVTVKPTDMKSRGRSTLTLTFERPGKPPKDYSINLLLR
jgi:hypothetical protein